MDAMMARDGHPSITVLVKRLPHYPAGMPLPEYAHPGDSGFDLIAAVERPVALYRGVVTTIPTGLAFEIPEGYELQVRPRSGLAARHGVTLVNSPGTVDSGYRGEVKVVMTVLKAEPFAVNPGDRIAQAVLAPVVRADLRPAESLTASQRGEGGFGSTGV